MNEVRVTNAFHENSCDHGFWDNCRIDVNRHSLDPEKVHAVIPEKLALIHSEVSEALECFRNDEMGDGCDIDGKPVGFTSELADVVIRIYDLAGALQLDLEGAIARKHEFNKTRPHKHGGKRI